VAEQLGGALRPWKIKNPNSRIHVTEQKSLQESA
ncbi:MAG: hypothetical protein RL143_1362, partial [Pseudomonadota bacterium]